MVLVFYYVLWCSIFCRRFFEIVLIVGLLVINYNFLFAVIVALAVILYVAFSVVATEWRTRFVHAMNQAESQSSTRSVDSLLNYETVKYFSNEAYEIDSYNTHLIAWQNARQRNRWTLFFLNTGQSLIIAIAMTCAMIGAAYGVSNASMTIGDLVLMNAVMMQIFVPLNFLGFVYREMKGSMANIDAMFALLEEKPTVVDREDAQPLKCTDGEIFFDTVSFSYDHKRPILEKISFSIGPRQKLAIVGNSGAGKSTIMKLLFRFHDVDAGRILIDGVDIATVMQHSLRRAIGIIPQESVLFNTTLWENIRYGNLNASHQEILRAIEIAYLDEFIGKLPEGVHTMVGERGLKLSGGEKQRVAIARALLKNPLILVFDEATSSLDSKSEQEILRAIGRIQNQQTSVVIAHRLSTIVDADKIIVLDNGRLVEQGTHQELLNSGQKYAALWKVQAQQEQSSPS